jgi:hypothetical protein
MCRFEGTSSEKTSVELEHSAGSGPQLSRSLAQDAVYITVRAEELMIF